MAGELVSQTRARAHARGLALAATAVADAAGPFGGEDGARSQVSELASVFKDPLWAEVYWATCCDTGEVPSLAGARTFCDELLAQNPEGKADALSLRRMRVGASAVSCLGQRLKDRGYTRVDLSENQLGDNAALSVRTLVRALPGLRWLGLAGNAIGPEGAAVLAEELETNGTLEGLGIGALDPGPGSGRSFRPNLLGSAGLSAVLGALRRNPRPAMTQLCLANTNLGPEAAYRLAGFLEKTGLLQSLDLSGNPLTSVGVAALLPHCAGLRVLDISDTGCRGELVQAPLCAMLKQAYGLVRFSLAKNLLEARPLRRIAKGLAACASLVALSLEGTSLGTQGVCMLAEALLAAPVASVTDLDLSGNQLSQMAADAPSAAAPLARLVSRGVLAVLRLSRNPLGDAGVMELATALGSGFALQQLELCHCRLSTAGAAHLFDTLASNDTLRVLRLGSNYLDDTLDIRLVEALTHIQDLGLAGNRLSHATIRRADQACARNRQAAREEKPQVLRKEMHRLLFQETKLGQAREQIAAHDESVRERERATEHTLLELQHVRAAEAEARRVLSRQIAQEERGLEARQAFLDEKSKELLDYTARYEATQQDIRRQIREREQALLDVQVRGDGVETQLRKLKADQPQEIERLKAKLQATRAETQQLHDQEGAMKKQLLAMQDKSLIGFKP